MAGSLHALHALLALVFLAGSLILLWFVILSGITSTSPLRQTYFLQADTSGIPGARDLSQWTYFRICGADNTNCGPARPGLPLGDAWESNAANVPAELIGGYGGDTTSRTYWYMWRFGWVFYLIALFFETAAFFAGFLACFGRLGAALGGLVALVALVALVFLTIAVSLMTATFVMMRNAFVENNRSASLGTYAFGFSWGAWAVLLISTILFCLARRTHHSPDLAPAPTRGFGFGRRKSVANRQSYDGRRVKEEYP